MTKTPVFVSAAVRLIRPQPSCPKCGKRLDGATGMSIGQEPAEVPTPDPGDVAVCGYCAELLEYQADLTLSPLSPMAWAELAPEQRRLLTDMAGEVRARRRPGSG